MESHPTDTIFKVWGEIQRYQGFFCEGLENVEGVGIWMNDESFFLGGELLCVMDWGG